MPTKKKSLKNASNEFLYFFLLSATLVITLLLYKMGVGTRNLQPTNLDQSPVASPSPDLDPGQIAVADCNGTAFKDEQVGFSIICPTGMKVYLTKNWFDPGLQMQEKRYVICDQPPEFISVNSDRMVCNSAGVEIWANGDGWGGGCDAINHKTVVVNGVTKNHCSYSSGMNQLYFGKDYGDRTTRKDRFNVTGNSNETYDVNAVYAIIKSFRFLP